MQAWREKHKHILLFKPWLVVYYKDIELVFQAIQMNNQTESVIYKE